MYTLTAQHTAARERERVGTIRTMYKTRSTTAYSTYNSTLTTVFAHSQWWRYGSVCVWRVYGWAHSLACRTNPFSIAMPWIVVAVLSLSFAHHTPSPIFPFHTATQLIPETTDVLLLLLLMPSYQLKTLLYMHSILIGFSLRLHKQIVCYICRYIRCRIFRACAIVIPCSLLTVVSVRISLRARHSSSICSFGVSLLIFLSLSLSLSVQVQVRSFGNCDATQQELCTIFHHRQF